MKRTYHWNNLKGGGTKMNELERSGNPRSENFSSTGVSLGMKIPY